MEDGQLGDGRRRGWPRPVAALQDRLAVHRALASEVISLAGLIHRPVVDTNGARVGRVDDVLVRWGSGIAHPPVTAILVAVGRGRTRVDGRDLTLEQSKVSLRPPRLMLTKPDLAPGEVALARDILDHQLVDVDGVQVVRAADIYLAKVTDGWELAGVDVGLRSLVRRLLPKARKCPAPSRAIDWVAVQAFVPVAAGPAATGSDDHLLGAGTTGARLQFASRADELHKIRGKEVAALLADLGRRQQAQLAVLAESSSAKEALRQLEPSQLDALLAELDPADRARLSTLVSDEASR